MGYKDITILLVDDDCDHANLFKTNLQRKGITGEVKHFSNSFTLGKYLFDENIDHQKYNYLMLLDINIPGLDCNKLLTHIKKQSSISSLTIIALSESNSAIKDHYHAILSKPLIQAAFEETLADLNIFIKNCKISCTKKLVLDTPDS